MMNKEKPSFRERMGKAFLNNSRKLKTGWLLALTLIAFYGIRLAVRLAAGGAFSGLFSVWGLNASTVLRAPRWAWLIYAWHGSAITAIVSLVMLPVALCLRRFWTKEPLRGGKASNGGVLLLIGAGFAVASAILFLILDSMRLEWPLNRPEFSISQPVLLIILMISAVSEELFNKAVLLDGIKSRWGTAAAILVSTVVFFLDSAGYAGNVLCGINVALMGILCCCLYLKYGLWASAGFRCGCSFGGSMIMGFGAAEVESVYRVYHVSDGWLTGGQGGLIYGLWMTAALLAALILMNREKLKNLLRGRKTR